MNKSPSLLSLFLIIAALVVFGIVGARFLLSSHTEATDRQLALVWPDLAALPEADRAFIVELAHTCTVTERPQLRAQVVDCLRSVPMTGDARARLDRLVSQAPAGQ